MGEHCRLQCLPSFTPWRSRGDCVWLGREEAAQLGERTGHVWDEEETAAENGRRKSPWRRNKDRVWGPH